MRRSFFCQTYKIFFRRITLKIKILNNNTNVSGPLARETDCKENQCKLNAKQKIKSSVKYFQTFNQIQKQTEINCVSSSLSLQISQIYS